MTGLEVVKDMTKQKNILATIIITALLCLLVIFTTNRYFLPSFEEQIMFNIIDESKRVSNHVVSIYKKEKSFKHIDDLKNNLKLERIKLFDKQGKIIYSTKTTDIGIINTKEYFHNIVAKGEVFYKIVKSGKKL